jgi:predicted phage terminase large subunit-like protein
MTAEGFDRQKAIAELKLKRELLRRSAQVRLIDFIKYVNLDYKANWHHEVIANEVDAFIKDPDRRRLMVFLPPQHGKSEILSRCFPAYALGQNPDLKIAAASYSADLAKSFNRDVKRIIDGEYYKDVFPDTFLNSKNVVTDSKSDYLRNTEEFEIVGHKGSYKAVGVEGGLSGRPVDLAIIDDPIKDMKAAASVAIRKTVWEWYINVLEARLHNNSKVILIMTRWHEDDLAGRLLMEDGDEWEILRIKAIKEPDNTGEEVEGYQAPIDIEDPREIGEALWPYKHSLESLERRKKLDPDSFQALYQQNPTAPEGNKVKKEWFGYIEPWEVPAGLTWNLWIDGAYTKSTKNDPTGLMVAAFDERTKLTYIKHARDAYLELPDLLDLLPIYAEEKGLKHKSQAYIEPKASGLSLAQMIRRNVQGLAPYIIQNKYCPLVNEGKEARLQTAAAQLKAERIVLVKGAWNKRVVHQLTAYPKAAHDEYVDLLGYISYFHYQMTGQKTGVRRRN